MKAGATDAAKVLHAAIEAGANESGNIDWDLTDRNGLQAQAAEKALVRARQVATQMAAGGAHLGALIYASNQTPVQRFLATESSAETVMGVRRQRPPPCDPAAAGGGVGYGVCGVRD